MIAFSLRKGKGEMGYCTKKLILAGRQYFLYNILVLNFSEKGFYFNFACSISLKNGILRS